MHPEHKDKGKRPVDNRRNSAGRKDSADRMDFVSMGFVAAVAERRGRLERMDSPARMRGRRRYLRYLVGPDYLRAVLLPRCLAWK